MRISDWSSDVCSSDLVVDNALGNGNSCAAWSIQLLGMVNFLYLHIILLVRIHRGCQQFVDMEEHVDTYTEVRAIEQRFVTLQAAFFYRIKLVIPARGAHHNGYISGKT